MKRFLLAAVLVVPAALATAGGSLLVAAPLAAQDTAAWPRRVLLTNDDGVDTPGIHVLAQTLARDAEVYVAAPDGNRSGSGAYMSLIAQPLAVEEVDWGPGFGGVYSIDGYPADGVVWGVRGLLADDPPDLVISGINDGANAGVAWLVSGTIGAARTAAFLGIPALAVSGYDRDDDEAVRQAADWVARFVHSPMVTGLEPGEYLLVNMPVRHMDAVTGVVVAPLDLGFIDVGVQPGEEDGVWRFRWKRGDADPAGDWAAIQAGKIVITPMRVGETIPRDRFEALLDTVPAPGGTAAGGR